MHLKKESTLDVQGYINLKIEYSHMNQTVFNNFLLPVGTSFAQLKDEKIFYETSIYMFYLFSL